MSVVMGRYNDLVAGTQDFENIQPEDVGIDLSSESSLKSWSRGFVTSFSALYEAWQSMLERSDEEDRERFNALIPVLMIWSNLDQYKEANEAGDEELAEYMDTCRIALPATLVLIATMGITVYRATLPARPGIRHHQAVRSNPVGRNDACPCGSGKKYKRCCGIN